MNLVGRDLGQYRIVELIGQGGMAAVYKAYQPALERYVAVKVLPEQLALVPDFSDRFVREAKAIAQLNHPNILPVIDFGQEDGLSYIVMKHVRGGTLADRLRRPIDLLTTTRLVEQIAAALDHAHSRGIIHRDVKPSNVLMDEGEWVQLADFGLAKIVARDENLTGTGTGMGTPAYLSPEQGRGLPLDHHTDVYSLGVVVYEMVAGRLPFAGENLVAVVMKHIYEPPPLPRASNPDVPEAVQAVVLRALAKSPADRFDSAGDLAYALRKAVTGSSPPAGIPVYGAGDAHATPIVGLPELQVDVATLPHDLLITETVPGVAHFVGREQELAACRAKLDRDRFLVVTGMAGVGKSTLGAKLARDVAGSPDRIFWFTFDRVEKSTADALYWAVAAFLNNRGDSSLWRFLKGAVDAEKPLEHTARLNLLLAGLAPGSYVLCFDDFHLVADVPEIVHIFRQIRHRFLDLRQELPAWFVIMGRDVPADLEYAVGAPLEGFTREDAESFVASRGLKLPSALVSRLWQRTEGNAKLMELGASALEAVADDPDAVESFFEAMGRRGDVRDYLMTNIYRALSAEDRQALGALAVFPEAVEREAAEHVLDAEGVTDVVQRIDALVSRHLVGEAGRDFIHCHSLVRDYCYHVLDRTHRERFHRQAAGYYEEKGNHLPAAHHYFEGRAFGQALDLLTGHAQAIVNSGGAGGLLEQLARFGRHVLTVEQRVAWARAKIGAHLIRGEHPQALETSRAALQDAESDADRAELLRAMGAIHRGMGEHEEALEVVEQSLALSERLGDRVGAADAHHDIGWACLRLGRLAPAREHLTTSRHLGEHLGSPLITAKADLGLGLIDMKDGQLERARERFERSLHAFRSLGDRRREAMAIGNLGLIYYELNDAGNTLSHYRQAISIHEELGDVYSLCIAYSNLGYYYYEHADYAEAARCYERLLQLAQLAEHGRWLSMAHSGLADAHAGQGDLQQALDHARSAVRAAEQAGPGRELGIGYGVLGQVWLALGDARQARECFERGIPLLDEFQEHGDLTRARQGLEQALALIAAESDRP